jgi:glycosyltransferase involved in cell wall biosynthesis
MEDATERRGELEARVRAFRPDCILMCSWPFWHFMRLARRMRRRRVYVVAAMDNQWRGTPKQYLGLLTARWFLKPAIDTLLVSGDRQACFARKLGYERTLYGYYAAEVDRFATRLPMSLRPAAFLYVGRLVPVKNVAVLAEAYRRYRERSANPWSLMVAGAGPLASLFAGVPGTELLGFVQPRELPAVMRQARCFVMPSLREPWGVAIHEAAAAGLPIIATHACGATTAFVRDGVNGYVVSPHAESIAAAMVRMARRGEEELRMMSRASAALAGLWTPQRLAAYLHAMVSERLAEGVPSDGCAKSPAVRRQPVLPG